MFFKLFLTALPVFFVIDVIWIGFIAKNFYRDQVGFLMASQVNWVAAIVLYLILIGGLVFFAVMPAVESGTLLKAVLLGALFGFVTYAVYDLTNMATLKDWPLLMTVVDIVWGTVLGGLVSGVTYIIADKIL